jgi:hypothetical protein
MSFSDIFHTACELYDRIQRRDGIPSPLDYTFRQVEFYQLWMATRCSMQWETDLVRYMEYMIHHIPVGFSKALRRRLFNDAALMQDVYDSVVNPHDSELLSSHPSNHAPQNQDARQSKH